jgi:hypothetical protein
MPLDVDKLQSTTGDFIADQFDASLRNAVKQVHDYQGLYNFHKHFNAQMMLFADPKKRLEDFKKKWDELIANMPKAQGTLANEIEKNYANATPEEKYQAFQQSYYNWLQQQATILKTSFPDVFDKVENLIRKSIKDAQHAEAKKAKNAASLKDIEQLSKIAVDLDGHEKKKKRKKKHKN